MRPAAASVSARPSDRRRDRVAGCSSRSDSKEPFTSEPRSRRGRQEAREAPSENSRRELAFPARAAWWLPKRWDLEAEPQAQLRLARIGRLVQLAEVAGRGGADDARGRGGV